MIIWDPVERLVCRMASLRQRYRCLVDGQDELSGGALPVGTEAEILAWIEPRYKVLGELYAVGNGGGSPAYHWVGLLIHPEMMKPEPTTKRYLVEAEGVERMFVLKPVHEDLLGWHPERARTIGELPHNNFIFHQYFVCFANLARVSRFPCCIFWGFMR